MKRNSFFAIVLTALTITSVPVIASAANDPQNAPSQQPGTDGWITTKVKADLMATSGIPSTDISVTTNNGVVTLSGVVESKAQAQKADAVAKSIKGVKSVDSSALKYKNS